MILRSVEVRLGSPVSLALGDLLFRGLVDACGAGYGVIRFTERRPGALDVLSEEDAELLQLETGKPARGDE